MNRLNWTQDTLVAFPPLKSTLSYLQCPVCFEKHNAGLLHTYCLRCNSPLFAKYNMYAARQIMRKKDVELRPRGLWRWHELLPLLNEANIVSLGEGDAPLLSANRLGDTAGLQHLYIKDESGQPTGSFKARGLAMAVSKAIELGIKEFVIPTAGNAGGALSAYAARAGLPAHIFMPKDAPKVNIAEVSITGGDLQLVDGLINEAGNLAEQAAKENGWFDVSTFKEPYRLEGKKTMGFELAEAFHWELPDVIVYPTGGGTGLIGMWKAFNELEELGWIDSFRPRMVCVQASGCAPIVKAFEDGKNISETWQDAKTIAAGLRVPHAFADRLILRDLYESNGYAITVSDQEIIDAQKKIAVLEGIYTAPEGAATFAAVIKLLKFGWLDPGSRIVLYNTGTGLKYVHKH